MILSSKVFVPIRNQRLCPLKRNCSDTKMSVPMLSILAGEYHLQSLKLIGPFHDETTLEDGVVVGV